MYISPENRAGALIPYSLWILPRAMNSLELVPLLHSQLGQAPEAWGMGLRQKIESCGSHSGWDAVSLHENPPSLLQVKSEVS